jgi:hypothetical protein
MFVIQQISWNVQDAVGLVTTDPFSGCKGKLLAIHNWQMHEMNPVPATLFQNNHAQKSLMQFSSHRKAAVKPQPRKLNHAIIADTINATRRQTANFIPGRPDENRDLVDGFCTLSDCCK